jgi:hypothetical protein
MQQSVNINIMTLSQHLTVISLNSGRIKTVTINMETQSDPQTSSSSASYVVNNGFGPPGPSAPDPAVPTCIAPCHFLKDGSLEGTALHHNCRACYDHNEAHLVEGEELEMTDVQMLSQSSQGHKKEPGKSTAFFHDAYTDRCCMQQLQTLTITTQSTRKPNLTQNL